jgi:hypothetical protein
VGLTGVQVRPLFAVAIVVELLIVFPICITTDTAHPERPEGTFT